MKFEKIFFGQRASQGGGQILYLIYNRDRTFNKKYQYIFLSTKEILLKYFVGVLICSNIYLRPILFGAVFSGGTFGCCAVWQYENMREAAR